MLRNDFPGRKRLETLHIPAQVLRRGDKMQVVFEDDVTVETGPASR
ncbi:MAG: hypothetical protein ACREXS_10455 [Gammaproteobacteria bacterium]